jgi:hypothetical protein
MVILPVAADTRGAVELARAGAAVGDDAGEDAGTQIERIREAKGI